MTTLAEPLSDLPSDLAAAHAMILAERAARLAAQARAEEASAARHNLDIEIERLKLEIARLRRERYGASAERSARIEQLELSLEELEATAAEADAFSGFGKLYRPGREAGDIVEAACWAHARRKFFELADLKRAPMAAAAVKRIDTLFEVEREIEGLPPERRAAVRDQRSRPLVVELEAWLRENRRALSSKSATANAIDYMLKRWPSFTHFLDDGRICLSNNAAERALRGIAIGRRNWTFAGSDAGGRRAAAIYTLIETCRLNDVDPRAWLADVLERLPGHPASRLDELLPWNWKSPAAKLAA